MRRIFLLLAVLCVAPAFGSGLPKDYDETITLDELDGVWRETDSPFPNEIAFRGGAFVLKNGSDTMRGTYRSDHSRNPSHLDLTPAMGISLGRTFNFIYKTDGHALRIAGLPNSFTQRPQGFDDEGVKVESYKRVK